MARSSKDLIYDNYGHVIRDYDWVVDLEKGWEGRVNSLLLAP
jgi:hypothetical protein